MPAIDGEADLRVAIIGGTGLEDALEGELGLSDVRRVEPHTPFGAPSASIATGRPSPSRSRRVVLATRSTSRADGITTLRCHSLDTAAAAHVARCTPRGSRKQA